MEGVNALITRQYRVYPPDVIPFLPLVTGAGVETFRKHFRFREFSVEGTEFTFSGGIVAISEEELIVVNLVQINSQRIIAEVAGSSTQCTVAFSIMAGYIAGMDNEHRLINVEPLLLTHETQCTVKLAFDWQELLSERVAAFLRTSTIERLTSTQARARLTGLNLRFTVQYEPTDERLREYGISHADKLLVIEPRLNTPESERLYFAHSPLDTDTHLDLIKDFEQALMTSASRRRLRS